jgi:hypothetical protein
MSNLAKSLASLLRDCEKTENKDLTVNDFFEMNGIPKEQRSDFVFAAILNQAEKYLQENT